MVNYFPQTYTYNINVGGRCCFVIDYSPLWETMQRKNLSTYQLINDFNFSKGTLDSLKHNRNVTLHTIETLCSILNVPIQDVVQILPDNQPCEKTIK